MMTSI
jgi:hypothetical protein